MFIITIRMDAYLHFYHYTYYYFNSYVLIRSYMVIIFQENFPSTLFFGLHIYSELYVKYVPKVFSIHLDATYWMRIIGSHVIFTYVNTY